MSKPVNKWNQKPVYQYSTDGKFIKRHDTISDGADSLGKRSVQSTIQNNLKGSGFSALGFIWFSEKVLNKDAVRLNEERFINYRAV